MIISSASNRGGSESIIEYSEWPACYKGPPNSQLKFWPNSIEVTSFYMG